MIVAVYIRYRREIFLLIGWVRVRVLACLLANEQLSQPFPADRQIDRQTELDRGNKHCAVAGPVSSRPVPSVFEV